MVLTAEEIFFSLSLISNRSQSLSHFGQQTSSALRVLAAAYKIYDNKPISAMKNLTIGEVDEHTAKITINKNNKPYFEIYSKENDKDIIQLLKQCAGIITQTDDDYPMGEIISKDEANNSFVYELDNKRIKIYFNKL